MNTTFGFLMGPANQAAGTDKKKQLFVFGLFAYLSMLKCVLEQAGMMVYLETLVRSILDGKGQEILRIMAIARNFGERYGTAVLDLGWINAEPHPEEYAEEAAWLLELIQKEYTAMGGKAADRTQQERDSFMGIQRR